MKYTKELIDLLLKDDTIDNDFINQLRGLAFAAQKEIESKTATNASYASPASSGVQTAGLNKMLEDIDNKLAEVETDVRIEITIEKGYGCISLYDQYADKIGDYDISESLKTMEDVLDHVIGRAKHLPKE